MIVHHVLVISSAVMALFAGYSMPMECQLAMLAEGSNIFLNNRTILGKKNTSNLALINNVLFFVSYTVFRILYLPTLIREHLEVTSFYDWDETPVFHKVAWWSCLFNFSLVYILNLYWYSFIVNGLLTIIGIKQPPSEDKNSDKYEKV